MESTDNLQIHYTHNPSSVEAYIGGALTPELMELKSRSKKFTWIHKDVLRLWMYI